MTRVTTNGRPGVPPCGLRPSPGSPRPREGRESFHRQGQGTGSRDQEGLHADRLDARGGPGARTDHDLEGQGIEDCEPGTTGFPACPSGADSTFFDQVPDTCDITIGTYSLRLVLMLLAAYPLDNVSIVGEFHTDRRPGAAVSTPGAVDAALFSTDTGKNCGKYTH